MTLHNDTHHDGFHFDTDSLNNVKLCVTYIYCYAMGQKF
jgi:hypothetical protein